MEATTGGMMPGWAGIVVSLLGVALLLTLPVLVRAAARGLRAKRERYATLPEGQLRALLLRGVRYLAFIYGLWLALLGVLLVIGGAAVFLRQ